MINLFSICQLVFGLFLSKSTYYGSQKIMFFCFLIKFNDKRIGRFYLYLRTEFDFFHMSISMCFRFLSLKSMHVKYIENQCIFYVGYADGVDRQIKMYIILRWTRVFFPIMH